MKVTDADIDWDTIHTVHMVGIKGVAMTSLSLYLLDRGMNVTGSDVNDDFPTKAVLDVSGISIADGFSPDHIKELSPAPDLVIYTGAHGGGENPEVVTAIQTGIPVLAHGKALGSLMRGKIQVSVAGSHGKTTTAAMIATMLVSAGKNPSFAIGCGSVRPIGNPGHFGKGKIFVAEADEYMTDPVSDRTPRFFWQNPDIFVVTNIDFDHPDAYASITEVQEAFRTVQNHGKGSTISIVNADDPNSSVLFHPSKGSVETYGTDPSSDYQVFDISMRDGKTIFALSYRKKTVGTFEIRVPGVHNALNAAAAAAAARKLDVSWDEIRKGLSLFAGTKRRFEIIGEENGRTIVDDYAHHPTEIEKTLSAAKSWYPNRRIITVFQPHTYSRTRTFFREFVHAFHESDIVLVSDIYASAREQVDPTMSGAFLADEMKRIRSTAYFKKSYRECEAFLDEISGTFDVILFLGAGDIASWGKNYFDHMRKSI